MAVRWLCVSAFGLLLAACGGGGGTNTDGSLDSGANQSPASGGSSSPGSGNDGSGASDSNDGGIVFSPSDFTYDSGARFNTPASLSRDNAGNLYVMDDGNDVIRRITANGHVSTLSGSYATGMIAERTTTNGHLHVLNNGRLYRVSPSGTQILIREFAGGPGSYSPSHVASDGDGNAYVLMVYRQLHEIWRIDTSGNATVVYSDASYGSVSAIASDSAGNLALAMNGPVENTAFVRYIPRSSQPAEYDTPGVTTVVAATSYLPSSMIIDGAGNAYFNEVSIENNSQTGGYDYTGMRIFRVNNNGIVTALLQGFPDGSTDRRPVLTERWYIHAGLTRDAEGRIYFSDPRGNAIYRIDGAGNLTLIAGMPGQAGNSD